jgi:hypothetical protein
MADKARKNYKNYLAGKEPLKVSVLHQGGETPIHDFITKNMERRFWVLPFDKFKKLQKNKNKK